MAKLKAASEGTDIRWVEKAQLVLRRGPYIVVGGPDEAAADGAGQWQFKGRLINLFDPELQVRREVQGGPGSRLLLLDLDRVKSKEPRVLAAACKALPVTTSGNTSKWMVEGIAGTPAVVLLQVEKPVREIRLGSEMLTPAQKDPANNLLWLKFGNTSSPRELVLEF